MSPWALCRWAVERERARALSVDTHSGEWIELHNAGDAPVNLRGWTLWQPTGSERIAADLHLAAKGYAVLASDPDPLANGGVPAQMAYSQIILGSANALTLLRPDNSVADTVLWGETVVPVHGRSLERTDYAHPEAWRYAWRMWQGSAGDWGSPGAPNQPPPTPDPSLTPATRTPRPTGTATRAPTATRTPSPMPTITPTLAPLPEAWQWRDEPSPLWLDEVGYRGDDEEFVVLANRSSALWETSGHWGKYRENMFLVLNTETAASPMAGAQSI